MGRPRLLQPGETVRVELWRGSERTELEVELAAAPGAHPLPAPSTGTEVSELGLAVAEITPEVRDRFAIPDAVSGVAVLEVGEEVPPEVLIEEGDVIVGVQREPVASVPDLRRALERVQAEDRNAALLLVQRGDARRFVAVPMLP